MLSLINKANIPTRLGLKVSSNIDSRTILDSMGAEQLLDLVICYTEDQVLVLQRIHGAFVSETEINKQIILENRKLMMTSNQYSLMMMN